MREKIKIILNFFLFILGYEIKKISNKQKLEINLNNKLDFNENERDSEIVCNQIYKFLDRVDLFYNNLDLKEPLKIKGAWRGDLLSRRKIQNNIYESKNNEKIIQFHENMFFNELMNGIINYSYFEDVKPKILSKFYDDYVNFVKIFNYPEITFSNIPFKRWGIKLKNNILSFDELWHTEQSLIIKNICNNFIEEEEIFFLEIGSGYGGMIEKLYKFKLFKKYFLVDIPHNLITTYYFLSKIYGEEQVCLVNNIDFIPLLDDTKIMFFLIPSCFFEEIKKINKNFIISNSGSFSEMDLNTINFYIKNLPPKILSIVSNNSNENTLNFDNHIEVKNDDIHFQNLNLVYEGFPISSTSINYKTKIFFK